VSQAPAAAFGDIVALDAAGLARAIAARQLSCAEVMGAYLDHIEAVNPAVNAIISLQPRDALMAQAREKEAEVAAGGPLGPLHGFPLAVKDLSWVRGIPCTSGSPFLKDFVPAADSLMVERMRAAGAIFIGKTNTPEFGLGSHTFNPVHGVTLNAYDRAKSAGGSSGGAAVALATRMAPVADGSDYGGSLRNPAGWNNVYGFRCGPGVVPAAGEDVWGPTMAVNGPMARTVDDLARLLSVQAGFDPRAPMSVPLDGARFRAPLESDMAGKRIGWLGDFGGWAPHESGVLEVCRGALKAFEDLGCIVEDASFDHPPEPVWGAFKTLRHWQAGGNLLIHYRDPVRRALMKEEAIWEVERGFEVSAYDVAAAHMVRSAWSNAARRLFERFDYLIAPTAQVFAFDASMRWPRQIAGETMTTYHEWMKAVCLITMTGCPALAAPAGLSSQGLPMGIQIIAPIGGELDCLRLAKAHEAATGWVQRRPPS
jgi:amidase